MVSPDVNNELNIFCNQIEKELNKLSSDKVVRFAWRCAVRALPFIGANGNFDFWKKEERQKYLYAILNAYDTTYAVRGAKTEVYDDTTRAALGSLTYAARAAKTSSNYNDDTARAIFAANYAAIAAYETDETARVIHDAVRAAKAAAMGIDHLIFQQLILDDLQSSIPSSEVNLIEVYGSVWNNFKNALEENGCGYWSQWYQNILEKGLVLHEEDEKEIEMRLNVPAEIRDQGAAAVGRYMEELGKGAERLNEARILILGDKGAGKTCLSRRLKDPNAEMTTDEESTPGVDTTLWKLEKENVNVHIWDFAGHTVTHAVHQFFLSERCLYIIVYDGRTEGRNRLEYWLDHMKNYGQNSQAIILINKRDDYAVEVPINRLKEQYPILGVYTFSIRDDNAALENFRQEVANYISNNPSWSQLLIPENSYKVKNELEKLFVNGGIEERKERIQRNVFDAIAKRYGVEDGDALLSDLHALGISLWYKEMNQFNTLVLNPEWISNGVYRIINWANNEKKHCLRIEDFDQVFSSEALRYPQSEHRFLFELMKKYELAYEAKEKDVLIIPRLLEEDQPASLPQFQIGESLMARYKADQPLMPDTISRFIVRHNEEIKKEGKNYLVWRSGVILEEKKHKGTIALVRETDDRTISVSVKGANRTEYLSALRETLNNIFEGYKSKKPELQYRVERFGEISEEIEKQDPLWLADRKIFNHALDNVPYYDDSTRQSINLIQTVNNYNVTAQTFLSGTGNQYLDQSIHNTFNFKDCNFSLQGNLNDLARQLNNAGKKEEAAELKEAATLLAEAEECSKPEEVKKKGILRGLKQFAEKLGDEESSLCKTIKGIEKGIDVAQDIAKEYNKIAQWLVLPQIPNVFLKK